MPLKSTLCLFIMIIFIINTTLTTVRTTPTARNAMDNMNIQRPAVSSVDQRLDICDSMDAPTRPSLSTVEIDERDASVS